MTMIRNVKRLVTGSVQYDGAGVKLVRVLGNATVEDFDPFLMLDAFDSVNPEDYVKGFPWHPHRGIETVTYLIRGRIEHGDSLGNRGVIADGGCQWMTAGGGILHQEMPQPSERMLGVQLWLNLPRRDKMTAPEYRDITEDMVPKVRGEGSTVAVISGHYNGAAGAVQGDYVQTLFLDVALEAGVVWKLPTRPDDTVFAYLVRGSGRFGGSDAAVVTEKHAVLFGSGDELAVTAGDGGLRLLVLAAKALKEPVAWGGPIVMNTREELEQAFQEIRSGTFIRKSD